MLQSCNEFLWRNSPGASINHRGCAVPLICPVLQKPLTAPEGDQLLQKYSSPPQPKPQPVTGTAPPFSAPPPAQSAPQIPPNLAVAGPINPNAEQVHPRLSGNLCVEGGMRIR